MSRPKPTELCIIHYESVESLTELVQLRDLGSWKNLLKAVKIRHYAPLIGISTEEDAFPKVSYHATFRSVFTMKRALNALAIKSKGNQSTARQSVRHSQPTTLRECGKLERKCIFCNKEKKYVKRKLDSFFPITEMTACYALCTLKAIEPIALFYRYNFKIHFSGHGIGSIAYFYRFF